MDDVIAVANPHCKFIRTERYSKAFIRREDVCDLSQEQKKAIFGDSLARISARTRASAAILDRLCDLAPSLSSCLVLKASQVDDFVFRLINPFTGAFCNSRPSYVALSYRWGAGKFTLARSDSQQFYKGESITSLTPIPPNLYDAVVSELDSKSEGLWCDQACINQADTQEKAVSVGMMNVIYEQARYVAIILADILVSSKERLFMQQYATDYAAYGLEEATENYFHCREQPCYLTTQPLLREFYLKIMKAEWFSRCWCSHEMRMSRRQVFFAPCEETEFVCRFTGEFLFHLILLAIEVPNPWTSTLLRPFSAAHHTVLSGVFERPHPNMILEPFEHIADLYTGGDPDPALSEAQRHATAVRDKLSITLNTMQLDLTVNSASFLDLSLEADPMEQSKRLLSALSLAIGDPLVLCTSGAALPSAVPSQTSSWLRGLIRSDIPFNQQSTEESLTFDSHDAIPVSPSSFDAFISLPLYTFGVNSSILSPTRSFDALASITLHILLRDNPTPSTLSEGQYAWRIIAQTTSPTQALLQRTLACLLQLGPAWLLAALSVQKNAFEIATDLRRALEPYADDGCFPGLTAHATTPKASFGPRSFGEPPSSRTFIAWLRTEPGAAVTALVVQFAIFVMQRSLPGPWKPDLVVSYASFLLAAPRSGALHLAVIPVAEAAAVLAVPACLVDDRFFDMCRFWLLSKELVEGERQWTLRGRLRVFGGALEGALQPMETNKGATKVTGPLMRGKMHAVN